jgi:sn-glycerol 3-phosphate transport system substrate-binding protein
MVSRAVIDVWVPDLGFPGWMDRWYAQGAEFENLHPEYQVEVRGIDFFAFPQEVSRSIAAGRTPTVAEYYFYTSQLARDQRAPDGSLLYTSVEKAIAGRTEILGEPVVTDDVLPAFRDYFSYGGDLTSMPSVGTTTVLYANTKLLEAAGVSELPRTWDEVEAACETIARSPGGPAHAITWSNHGTFFQQALATQGGQLVDHDNGRSGRATTVDLASKEMLAWVEWWRHLHDAGHYLYTGDRPDWAGTLRAFAEQQVALRISSSNDVNYMFRAAEEGGFGVQVGTVPYNSAVPYVGNAVAGTSMWLADGLDDTTRDGALALLQFLHSPTNAAGRHKANSFIPITHASRDLLETEGWFDEHPHHRVAGDQISGYPALAADVQGIAAGSVPPSRGAVFGDFAGNQDLMTHAMGDVLTGADPVDRFTRATTDAQKQLGDYNAYALAAGPRDPDGSSTSSHRVEFYTDVKPYTAADMEKVVRLNR